MNTVPGIDPPPSNAASAGASLMPWLASIAWAGPSMMARRSDNDAEGFGFVGINGSGWAEETHPFTSPSYGIVGSDRIDYPFNLECGTSQQVAQSDVEAWIYDTAGVRSQPVIIQLSCTGNTG
jgi:hypothetical protein